MVGGAFGLTTPHPFIQGCYTKFIVLYKTAFWKSAGYSGDSVNLRCNQANSLVDATFDYTTVTSTGEVGGPMGRGVAVRT